MDSGASGKLFPTEFVEKRPSAQKFCMCHRESFPVNAREPLGTPMESFAEVVSEGSGILVALNSGFQVPCYHLACEC
jgi:hypothetical protein